MEKIFIRITIFIGTVSSLSYLVFIFLRNYNSPENIEVRCLVKFKKEPAYTIQVFASRNHQNAKILVGKLKKSGYKEAFIFKHTAGSKTLYRVRVGKLERSKTQKFANDLKKLKYIDSVQVTRF